jgi:hypothetical protein
MNMMIDVEHAKIAVHTEPDLPLVRFSDIEAGGHWIEFSFDGKISSKEELTIFFDNEAELEAFVGRIRLAFGARTRKEAERVQAG